MFTSTVQLVEKGGRIHARIEHQAHGAVFHMIEVPLAKHQSKTLEEAQESAVALQRQLTGLVRHTADLVSKEWQKEGRKFFGIE